MAAPSKLTDALLEKLDTIADDGLTLKEVCTHLGIDARTWRRWEAANETESPFRRMAARVRAGMGSATDDMAWGVLHAIASDGGQRASDRLAAAQAILRLRTAHRVEVTGRDGGPVEIEAGAAIDRLDALIAAAQPKQG